MELAILLHVTTAILEERMSAYRAAVPVRGTVYKDAVSQVDFEHCINERPVYVRSPIPAKGRLDIFFQSFFLTTTLLLLHIPLCERRSLPVIQCCLWVKIMDVRFFHVSHPAMNRLTLFYGRTEKFVVYGTYGFRRPRCNDCRNVFSDDPCAMARMVMLRLPMASNMRPPAPDWFSYRHLSG